MTRRLWIDTKGQPVITTTPNGVSNATRWGWTPAVAVASEQAKAIDRMGPAARCHLCVGAGGYPDHYGQWVECTCQRPDQEPSDAEPVAYALHDRDDGELVSVQRWPTGTEHVAFDVRPLYAAQEVRHD